MAKTEPEPVRDPADHHLVICPFINGWIGNHREYVDVLYGAPPSKVTD
jgi:uncharacterized protein